MDKRLTTEVLEEPYEEESNEHTYNIVDIEIEIEQRKASSSSSKSKTRQPEEQKKSSRRSPQHAISSPVSLDVGDASVEFFPEQVIQNIVLSLRSSQVSLNFNDTCLSSFAER